MPPGAWRQPRRRSPPSQPGAEPTVAPAGEPAFDALRNRFVRGFSVAMDEIWRPENEDRIPRDLPIFVACGEKDPAGGFTETAQILLDRYQALGVEDLTVTFYPDARHEILNETNHDEVRRDMLGCLDAASPCRADPLPGSEITTGQAPGSGYGGPVCFSPEADLVAGAVVTAAGIDALRHVRAPREKALATLPVVFGVHQFIEVPVWWGLEGRVPAGVADPAAWAYLAIAFGVIPWLVPLAVRRLEVREDRRRLMTPLVWIGIVVAVALMIPTIQGPVVVTDGGNHVSYSVPLVAGGLVTVVYVVATCGSALLSSDRMVVVYGAVNLAAVIVLAALLTSGVISLWCVWAAVTSVAIALHLRGLRRRPAPLLVG